MARDTRCFFAGTVSAAQRERNAYLIDDVAINGVSGGPVLYVGQHSGKVSVVGTITAYRPNLSCGEMLPGLGIAQDVSHFHDVAAHVKSIDDAERAERIKRDFRDALEHELKKRGLMEP